MRSFDGKEIYTRLWMDVDEPKGVVQICHGLAEHCGRYDAFAQFLNKNGFIAFADDHRGHGQTDNASGDCGDDPCGDTVKDLLFFNNWLHEQYPDLPLAFFGHSYGSILARRFIEFESSTSVCVMTGVVGIEHGSAAFLTAIMVPFKAICPQKKMGIDNASSNKKFSDTDVPFAWLTRDKDIRQQYDTDPLCGGASSMRFMWSSMKLMRDTTDPKNIRKIRSDLPIGMFYGEEDIAGGMGKGVKGIYDTFLKNGKKAYMKSYPEARHEVLNETNKDEVYEDILQFIIQNIGD